MGCVAAITGTSVTYCTHARRVKEGRLNRYVRQIRHTGGKRCDKVVKGAKAGHLDGGGGGEGGGHRRLGARAARQHVLHRARRRLALRWQTKHTATRDREKSGSDRVRIMAISTTWPTLGTSTAWPREQATLCTQGRQSQRQSQSARSLTSKRAWSGATPPSGTLATAYLTVICWLRSLTDMSMIATSSTGCYVREGVGAELKTRRSAFEKGRERSCGERMWMNGASRREKGRKDGRKRPPRSVWGRGEAPWSTARWWT